MGADKLIRESYAASVLNQLFQDLAIKRLEAKTELRAIYEERELLLPADQDHLFDDVNTHLAYSTNSIRNWLNTYQGLFTDSILKAKKRALDGVCSIRSYFQPA
jgi:hypothetical protein